MSAPTTPMPTATPKEARDPATMNAIAWQPRRGMDLAEWLHQGKRIGAIGRGSAWWIGDWVNYGNSKFGEKYTRASRITGYDSQSLMNMAYVASRVDVSRRREELSWSHHAEVAPLTPEEQEQWLCTALREGLSVHRLRERLRAARAGVSLQDDGDEASTEDELGSVEPDEPAPAAQPVNQARSHASNGARIEHPDIEPSAGPAEQDSGVICPRCGYQLGGGHT